MADRAEFEQYLKRLEKRKELVFEAGTGGEGGYRILPSFVKHSVKHNKKWATA
jgi:hypothetical protein